MIIPINDKYQISSNSLEWRIDKRKTEKDHYIWVPIAFFPRFEQAAESLGNRLIRESNAVGVAEAMVEIKRITSLLTLALPSEYRLVSIEHEVRNE